MRNSILVGSVASLALIASACGEAPTSAAPTGGAENAIKGAAGGAMTMKVDPNGTRWIPRRRVVTFDESPTASVVPTRQPRPALSKAATLSDIELAKKTRAIMLDVDDVEYEMDADQALEFARAVKAKMLRGVQDEADSAFGEGETPTVSPSIQTLNNGVFNGESRVNMNAYAQNYPWNLIGHQGDYNVSPPTPGCTIFKLINHYTAVTSAHCVYGSGGWTARKDLRFSAGSATPRGVLPRQCYAITVPGGWSSDVGDDEYDYAVIRLREGGSTGAWCNYNDYNTGYFGYRGVSGCTTNVSGDMAGYPAKTGPGAWPPGAWTYPTLFNDYRTNGWTSCVTYPNHLWYYNDNCGGQSGAPFWTNYSGSYKVRAINMAIFTGVFDDSNGGRRIEQDVIDFFNANKGY